MEALQLVLQRLDRNATHRACAEVAEEQAQHFLSSLSQAQDALNKIQQMVQVCDGLSLANPASGVLNGNQWEAMALAHQQLVQQFNVVQQLITTNTTEPKSTSHRVDPGHATKKPTQTAKSSLRDLAQADFGSLSSYDTLNEAVSWRRSGSDACSESAATQRSGRKPRWGDDPSTLRAGLYEPPLPRQTPNPMNSSAQPPRDELREYLRENLNWRIRQTTPLIPKEECKHPETESPKQQIEQPNQHHMQLSPRLLNDSSTDLKRRAQVDRTMQTMQQVSSLLSSRDSNTKSNKRSTTSSPLPTPTSTTTATLPNKSAGKHPPTTTNSAVTDLTSVAEHKSAIDSPPLRPSNLQSATSQSCASPPQLPQSEPQEEKPKSADKSSSAASSVKSKATTTVSTTEIAAVDLMMEQFSQILKRQEQSTKSPSRIKITAETNTSAEASEMDEATRSAEPIRKTVTALPSQKPQQGTERDQSPPRRRPPQIQQLATSTPSLSQSAVENTGDTGSESSIVSSTSSKTKQLPQDKELDEEVLSIRDFDISKIKTMQDHSARPLVSVSSGDLHQDTLTEDGVELPGPKSAEIVAEQSISCTTTALETTAIKTNNKEPMAEKTENPSVMSQTTSVNADQMDDMMKRFSAILRRQEVEQMKEKAKAKTRVTTTRSVTSKTVLDRPTHSAPVSASGTDPSPLQRLPPIALTPTDRRDEAEPERTPTKASVASSSSQQTTSTEASAVDEMMKRFAEVLKKTSTTPPSSSASSSDPVAGPGSATSSASATSKPVAAPAPSASATKLSAKEEMLSRFQQVTNKQLEMAASSGQQWTPTLNPFAAHFAPMTVTLAPTMPSPLTLSPTDGTMISSPSQYVTAPQLSMTASLPGPYQMTMPMTFTPVGPAVLQLDDDDDHDVAFANTTFGYSPSGLLT